MAVNWVEYFGERLKTNEGIGATNELLNGKARIGIYFAAHWNPPCRGFTPILTEFYESVFKANSNDLAIVFVSADSDDQAYEDYYEAMPWYAVPYEDRDRAEALGTKFGIRSIPFFIVLDSYDGSMIDSNGRSTVVTAKGDVSKALSTWRCK